MITSILIRIIVKWSGVMLKKSLVLKCYIIKTSKLYFLL